MPEYDISEDDLNASYEDKDENLTYDQQLIRDGNCPELVMYQTEDGPVDGRCLAPIVPGGYACEGHTAAIESWRSMSEAERAADEYNREMFG